ncbi:MAG: phosphoenolpyruvate--protein phosphotransferase [Oscillospiraceae bacterium]
MTELVGLAGAPGYGAGTAVHLRRCALSTARVSAARPADEVAALEAARSRYRQTLLTQAAAAHGDPESTSIFEGYTAMVDDEVFFSGVKRLILAGAVCASYALEQKRAETVETFLATDNDFLRTRADDFSNVCHELMADLQGVGDGSLLPEDAGNHLVVFAQELSPSDIVKLDPNRLSGIVTYSGGVNSHTAILAKALGIPAVVGIGTPKIEVADGLLVLVDGTAGRVLLQPNRATQEQFLSQQKFAQKQQLLYDACCPSPAVTLDGTPIRVGINSGDRESIEIFDPTRCDGVGLFRTEFLYMETSDYPSEETQFAAYRDMAISAKGKELIIRTLDAGGDKQLAYMDMPAEANPFLGYRAIRLCLDRPALFKTQLRAILRASAYGDVKIMFPMIVNLEELLAAKKLLHEAMEELDAQKVPYRADIPVGIMIETPAAVLLSDRLARHVSFFSVGSNDLIQYTTATDRMNERMSGLYDSCNLSVLRSVALTCKSAHDGGIPIDICGEIASEPRLVPLWCAMGIDTLSVSPALVGRTKYIISHTNRAALQEDLSAILVEDSIQAVKIRLNRIISAIL